MLEMGTSGLMSGEGKRVGMHYDSGTAPFLDSTPRLRSSSSVSTAEDLKASGVVKLELLIAEQLALHAKTQGRGFSSRPLVQRRSSGGKGAVAARTLGSFSAEARIEGGQDPKTERTPLFIVFPSLSRIPSEFSCLCGAPE
jgi:hypothetical protein